MSKYLEILIGLFLLSIAVYAWATNLADFGRAAVLVLQGVMMWVILGVGLILVMMGLAGLRE